MLSLVVDCKEILLLGDTKLQASQGNLGITWFFFGTHQITVNLTGQIFNICKCEEQRAQYCVGRFKILGI
jgi:hypothetical protein